MSCQALFRFLITEQKKKTFALYILYKYKYRKFSLFQAVLAASNKSAAQIKNQNVSFSFMEYQ